MPASANRRSSASGAANRNWAGRAPPQGGPGPEAVDRLAQGGGELVALRLRPGHDGDAAAAAHDAAHLFETPRRIWEKDHAEYGQRRVEGVVRKGEVHAVHRSGFDLSARGLGPAAYPLYHPRRAVDRRDERATSRQRQGGPARTRGDVEHPHPRPDPEPRDCLAGEAE
jgi:hypothetical protein